MQRGDFFGKENKKKDIECKAKRVGGKALPIQEHSPPKHGTKAKWDLMTFKWIMQIASIVQYESATSLLNWFQGSQFVPNWGFNNKQ